MKLFMFTLVMQPHIQNWIDIFLGYVFILFVPGDHRQNLGFIN